MWLINKPVFAPNARPKETEVISFVDDLSFISCGQAKSREGGLKKEPGWMCSDEAGVWNVLSDAGRSAEGAV